MKLRIAAAVLLCLNGLLCLTGQAAAAPVPARRIMSLKLCTDELLMDLVPVQRIASISYLSREPAALRIWPQAARIPVNHNSIEEVLVTRPDAILIDEFQSPAMRALLAKSGARLIEVPEAENFDQIRQVTRQVGRVLGVSAKAETLIAQMDATLAQLAADKPAQPIRIAGWGGGGYVPGRMTLFNALVEAAGGENIAGAYGGYYDVEALIAARPQVLAFGDDYYGLPSLRRDQDDHPALAKFIGRRVIYPSAPFACGLPRSAGAARDFRAALQRAMR